VTLERFDVAFANACTSCVPAAQRQTATRAPHMIRLNILVSW
jgi:hypothetical protein